MMMVMIIIIFINIIIIISLLCTLHNVWTVVEQTERILLVFVASPSLTVVHHGNA